MAYKVFQNGFPLPASDLNNFLMNQSVITFANSGARSSAIASPVQGMITYIESTNKYEFWNGSAWVDLNDNTDAIPKSIMDAQGDLIVASGADTPARLALGGSGALLKSNGTTATWQAIGASGRVLTSTGTDVTWAEAGGSSMVQIASVNLTGNQVDFNSIPNIYRDLRLVLTNVNLSTRSTARLRVNATSGIYGRAFSTSSVTSNNYELWPNEIDPVDGAIAQGIYEIFEYAGAATFKFIKGSEFKGVSQAVDFNYADFGGGARIASAISSISLQAGTTGTTITWSAGTATLYGVR